MHLILILYDFSPRRDASISISDIDILHNKKHAESVTLLHAYYNERETAERLFLVLCRTSPGNFI